MKRTRKVSAHGLIKNNMYFKIISTKNNIDHNIVANQVGDAVAIARAIYPTADINLSKITHAEFCAK
jgi:hypothetical protein